jgi:hypothetical protein
MADETKKFPEFSQRDPSKPWNQLHPRSKRTSGAELDEVCGDGTIPQAEGGMVLADAMPKLDDGKK